jgi:sugar O-acyltransferase (sialic acid O-acetyltransferase NeuD family)
MNFNLINHMQDIIIYGAGGFGREVNLLLRQINRHSLQWNVKGFCDDGKHTGELIDNLPVLGNVNYLKELNGHAVVLAIADPAVRRTVFNRISDAALKFPNLIHPQAYFDADVNRIGKGCVITAGCYFTVGIDVGNFVIVNLSCTIGHDVRLGDFSSVMPGSNISGNVSIGECTLIGTGAKILQNLSLGANSCLGAGAVMTRSFGNDCLLKGIPARDKL